MMMTTERGFFGRLLSMRMGRMADIEMQANSKMHKGIERSKKKEIALKFFVFNSENNCL